MCMCMSMYMSMCMCTCMSMSMCMCMSMYLCIYIHIVNKKVLKGSPTWVLSMLFSLIKLATWDDLFLFSCPS